MLSVGCPCDESHRLSEVARLPLPRTFLAPGECCHGDSVFDKHGGTSLRAAKQARFAPRSKEEAGCRSSFLPTRHIPPYRAQKSLSPKGLSVAVKTAVAGVVP